jgi:lambda family phage portal protein
MKSAKARLISKIKETDSRIVAIRTPDERPFSERGYREISGIGKANADWGYNLLGSDSDVWQNAWALTARGRDLCRTNPLFTKFRETSWVNTYGVKGLMLRMKCKEEEDRVIHTPDEAKYLRQWEERINRIRRWATKQDGRSREAYRAFHLADSFDRAKHEDIVRGKATVKIGAPDLFANRLIEAGWEKWHRRDFCDLRKTRNYQTLRQLRLITAISDGDCFIRHIRHGKPPFGYSIQIISAEWCDRFYNSVLPNGNVIIMGIEYLMTPWGIGEPVAYYFIKRQPMDWQFSIPGAFNFASGTLHIRIDASEIIHLARPIEAESTRPAPWIAATIPKARQLDQYELSEVIAAREAACKVGFLYSDVVQEGGTGQVEIDPRTSMPKAPMAPGDIWALKYGVKYQERNPGHPSGNFSSFRKGMGQSITAGMPGADYNTLMNDLEGINFSAGRLGRLDSTEIAKNITEWDIRAAENLIFEAWLEMALMTGGVPLPIQKFEKFNHKSISGRAFKGVDEVKDVTAAALRVANKFSSRTMECEDWETDFDEVVMQQAEEKMTLEEFGLDATTTVEGVKQPAEAPDTASGDPDSKPAKLGDDDKESEADFQRLLALHRDLTPKRRGSRMKTNGSH